MAFAHLISSWWCLTPSAATSSSCPQGEEGEPESRPQRARARIERIEKIMRTGTSMEKSWAPRLPVDPVAAGLRQPVRQEAAVLAERGGPEGDGAVGREGVGVDEDLRRGRVARVDGALVVEHGLRLEAAVVAVHVELPGGGFAGGEA